MSIYNESAVGELLAGAYDLHVHSSPSHVARTEDDVQVYQAAAAAGMGGVMLKCHYEPTGARAELVERHFKQGRTRALGAVVLNWPVGGLNPYAVHSALRMGARMVWMPTRDSERSLEFGDMPGDFFKRPGITVLDEKGRLLPAVYDILDAARQYGAPVATGHLSMREVLELCAAGTALGNKMILTHPEWRRTVVPLETQLELAKMGVLIEKCWLNVIEGDCTEEYMLHTIGALGAESVFISTDSGLTSVPPALANYKAALTALLRGGFTAKEIRLMCRDNPERLIAR